MGSVTSKIILKIHANDFFKRNGSHIDNFRFKKCSILVIYELISSVLKFYDNFCHIKTNHLELQIALKPFFVF